MARFDSQEEISKRARKAKHEEPIFEEYRIYLKENGKGDDSVPSYYSFAMGKTNGSSLYKGYNLEELIALLKAHFK